jgi:hypothetical protein
MAIAWSARRYRGRRRDRAATGSPRLWGLTVPDEPILQDKAREAIRARKLPSRRPDRTSSGPGVGQPCAICGEPIKRDQVELEIQFTRNGQLQHVESHHVHLHCLAAWECELERTKSSRR